MGKKKRNKMKLANGEWKLAGKTNKHHILAKSRHGTYNPMNIVRWDINVHRAFHWLFSNRTLEEAAEYLRHMNELKLLGIEPDPTWGIQN